MKQSKQASKGSYNKNPNGFFSPKLGKDGDIIVKRMSLPNQTLATGAGTAIPVTSISSRDVQLAPATEWASFAARYQDYRVRAIRVKCKAIQPIQTATITHSTIYYGDSLQANTPASAAQVFSDEMVKETATHADFQYVTSWNKNPNAKLWNPTTATVPDANRYNIVLASATAPPLTTGTTYYSYTVEWEVEFRGSQ